jgi:hypothetical protein
MTKIPVNTMVLVATMVLVDTMVEEGWVVVFLLILRIFIK